MPMSHVFPRHTQANLPTASRAKGCYIYDSNGKAYLDGSGGAAVSCLGHGDAEVIAAIAAQNDALAFAHTGFFTSEPAEELADLLIKHAPGELERVYFVSGGSEAVEAAIKLARQFFVEIGQPERHRIIARRQSYHGNTLGALATGGNLWRREAFDPLLVNVSHIAPCFVYAEKPERETEWDYGQRVAAELETEILKLGPETVMAFVAEPVVGATAGAVPPTDGYFKKVREICDTYGVLLILDEVMCGMGRTGSLFSHEADGIQADIVCIAKGLGGGYQPIGATLCSKQIYEAVEVGSGFFQHGHTYLGHPTATAAGLAVVRALIERGLVDRVTAKGQTLRSMLNSQLGQHPHVGDIRGQGLFLGLELVANRATKEPFDPALGLAKKIKARAMENGLICYPMAGTRDGRNGDHVLLAPPFIADDAVFEELTDKLSRTLSETLEFASL